MTSTRIPKERWLCRLPPMTKRLRRARFWREYYSIRIKGYEELARRSPEIVETFSRIENAPESLRPPATNRVR
jgi:hypothetical protein